MKKLIILSLVLSFVNIQLSGQEASIDSIFAEYQDIPGCAIGIFQNGEIIFKKGYGIANLDYDIPITPETVFDIGSVSKQFTSACIVLLENEGKLSIEDPVRKYIPELPEYANGPITIRHLLNHTSGLRDYLTLMDLRGDSFDDVFTEPMGLDLMARQKALNFDPGSEYLYSNSGYLALAIIVRRVSGKSIGAYAMENIFKPLDMSNTFIYEDGSVVVKNRATGYSPAQDKWRREHHVDFVVGGDGQVYTTVEDFFKWSENFKSSKIGGDTFLPKMLTQGILNNGDTIDYALGIEHGEYKGHASITHNGAWGGFRASFVQYPDVDLSIVLMSNNGRFNSGRMENEVADLFLTEKEGTAVATKDKEIERAFISLKSRQLEAFTGEYTLQPGADVIITIQDDSLNVLQGWNLESYKVVPFNKTSFCIPDNPATTFKFFDVQEGSAHLLVVNSRGRKFDCKRKVEINLTESDLQKYTGRFFSTELDTRYHIKIEDGKLMATGNFGNPIPMIPSDHHEFSAVGNTVLYKETDGKVTGFSVDAGRVTNIQFVKE